MSSDVEAIEPIVRELVSICRMAGFAGKHCRLNVPVAVTEALSNAIVKGNRSDGSRQVKVAARIDQSALIVEVTDEGSGFDPEAKYYSPDDANWLEREDGRGLFLMRTLMDDVEYLCEHPSTCGHTVRLVLRRQ